MYTQIISAGSVNIGDTVYTSGHHYVPYKVTKIDVTNNVIHMEGFGLGDITFPATALFLKKLKKTR